MLKDRSKLHTILADKYRAKYYVENEIGGQYIIKTIAKWDHPSDIDFNELKTKCMLKTNHNSGGNVVYNPSRDCKNEVKRVMTKYFQKDQYKSGREWAYKNIQKLIFAEEFIDTGEKSLNDYKFYCFNGSPHFVHVDQDRFTNHRRNFYDTDWTHIDMIAGYEQGEKIEKPKKLDEMLEIASQLSKPFKFARIDLYSLPEVKFGEITFYPEAGETKLYPEFYNFKFGELIKL